MQCAYIIAHVHVHTYINTCAQVCMCRNMHACAYKHVCLHNTHTHTHTHTQTMLIATQNQIEFQICHIHQTSNKLKIVLLLFCQNHYCIVSQYIVCRITEKEYYTSKFESYTCNIKKTWQVIKNILNKNGTSPIAQSFNLNNKVTSDKEDNCK